LVLQMCLVLRRLEIQSTSAQCALAQAQGRQQDQQQQVLLLQLGSLQGPSALAAQMPTHHQQQLLLQVPLLSQSACLVLLGLHPAAHSSSRAHPLLLLLVLL
jgi:hypothetical protein